MSSFPPLLPFPSPLLSSPSPAIITLDIISNEPNVSDVALGTITAGLNSILWVGLVCFPFVQVRLANYYQYNATLNALLSPLLYPLPFPSHLPTHIQAARVTDTCEKLKATGPEIRARPLQYINTPQIELDSYITFLRAVRLRVSVSDVVGSLMVKGTY